jgi:hypothetical protein
VTKSRRVQKNAAHAREEREERTAVIIARAKKLLDKNERREDVPKKPKPPGHR